MPYRRGPCHGATPPESAAIVITDAVVLHMVREAKEKRGHALDMEELAGLPERLREPEAVYFDQGRSKGGQVRQQALIYVWPMKGKGAGKIVVRVNYSTGRGGRRIVTNTITSGRVGITAEWDLKEEDGYVKIKGNL